MKKIIVSENKQQQEYAIGRVNQICLALNRAALKMKSDSGYQLSIGELKMLINGDTTIVNKNFDDFLNSELDTLKITSKVMRDNFKNGSSEIIKAISKELNALSVMAGYEHINKLTIVNGEIVLSKEGEENIRESFRNIITTEKAQQLWTLQKEAAEKLNHLLSFLHENTRLLYSTLSHMAEAIFEMDPERKQIDIEELDYESVIKPELKN